MKKFAFTLEKVLSFHEQELDVKKQELSVLQASLKSLDKEIQRLKLELVKSSQEMSRSMATGLAASDIVVYQTYFRSLEQKIKLLTQQRSELMKKVEEKKDSVIQTNQDISGLEKLRDKQFQVYQASCRKQQELEIEEFVSKGIQVS